MININPRVDVAFKKIFGVEENKDLLISLVNSVLREPDQIIDLDLLNPYNTVNFKDDKSSILDIKAQGKDGKLFNIEIQVANDGDYDKRSLYYWAKLYADQLKAGDALTKTIGIHILNFNSVQSKHPNRYHNIFCIKELETDTVYYQDFEMHTIELKKFIANENEDLNFLVKKINSSLDMWIAFLTKFDLLNKNNLPQKLDNYLLKRALTVLEEMNFDEDERDRYESHLKWLRTEASALKKCREESLAEGIEIGKSKGIAIGQAKGIEIGQAKGEKKALIDVAQKMLSQGIEPEKIAKFTELALNEVLALRAKTKQPA